MVSQAPSRDGLALRSPRGHLLFRVSIQLQGCQRWNLGKRWTQKACKGAQGTLKVAFCKGRVNVWLGVKSLRLYYPLYALNQ
jgi:hypothetical protein